MSTSRYGAPLRATAQPRRRLRGAVAALGSIASLTAAVVVPAGEASAVTPIVYYVSSTGSDTNSGTSTSTAWRTVGRVNRATLSGGDKVLFQGGATFSDVEVAGNTGGVSGAPITYGSYGVGNARLILGVWVETHNFLVFDHLTATGSGIGGRGNDITIQNSDIGNNSIAINSVGGSRWRVQFDWIHDTTDSGILAQDNGTGSPAYDWVIDQNTIERTGTGGATFGLHGIYSKVVNMVITWNHITNFKDSGISVRDGNSTVRNNTISGGDTGISWFQYDLVARTSSWESNTISNTTTGIYVSDWDPAGGYTRESFVIRYNDITLRAGSTDYMNLQPTSGTYTVCCNTLH